jgi:flagellar protein FliL
MKPNHQECAMAVQEDDLDLDIDAEAGDGQGGRKKIILIVGAAILVLLLVSGGLTFWLLTGDSSTDPAATPGATEAAEGEQGEDWTIPTGRIIYVPLHPAFVVNFSGDSDVRFLQIELQIATRDPNVPPKMIEHDPAVRNNLVMLFASQKPSDLETREGKEQLRKQVLDEIRKVMKQVGASDKIENVYFTNFVMQ